jgi:MFS family permease
MTELTALRRFLLLTGLRWLPSGLLVPIFVLLPLARGLSLSQLGLAVAMQGLVVVLLELPTGGLADAVGRRVVLLLSMVFSVASLVLLLMAHSLPQFAAAFALMGVYRALDSGPLDAWYVDAAHAANPQARIDRGMGAQGTVVGIGIAAGALASSGLIAWHPLSTVDALAVPVMAALALQLVSFVVTALLMVEPARHGGWRRIAASVRETPRTVAAGAALLRHSPVLLALVCAELCWGFASPTYEGLFPVRVADILGGNEAAAAITGPAATAAWLVSAVGSACCPWLGRRLGMANAGLVLRVLLGVTVVGMGLFAGVVGVIVAYLACYAVHGGSNAAHMTLLHERATSDVRATVVSLNSMFAQPAGAIGSILLTALAQGSSVSAAMYAGAAVLVVSAPLYLVARRASTATVPAAVTTMP